MIKKILLAFDGSESSAQAFRYALELARKFGAGIEVFGVIRPPEFGGGMVETTALIEHGGAQFEEQVRALREAAQQAGVDARFKSVVGHPAERIVVRAEETGADLIVMGHRGKSVFVRWLTGSTTKQVMGYAHCAVLIVR